MMFTATKSNPHPVTRWLQFLPTRRYASAGTRHGLCPSVCVCHKSEFYRNEWTNQAGFWRASFLPPVLRRVNRKFGYLQKWGTSLWNFVLNSGLGKFCYGISIVETCYQLSWKSLGPLGCCAGMVICLDQGADLHMAQLMSLPLTVSCFSKIQIGFTFLIPAHSGSPRKTAVGRALQLYAAKRLNKKTLYICVVYTGWQWRNFDSYLCRLVFAAILSDSFWICRRYINKSIYLSCV